MSVSTIPAVYDLIVASLKLRAGLAGVNVFSGDVFLGDAGLECIALGDCTGSDDPQAMGGYRIEEYTIEGTLMAASPGAGEAVIKAARDRAFAIYAEIAAYLNDDSTLGGTVIDAEPARTPNIENDFNPEGRVCYIDFAIHVRAVTNP